MAERLCAERLEKRWLLSSALAIQVNGGDSIYVCLAAAVPHQVEVFVDTPTTSAPTYSAAQGAWSAINFVGGSGNESYAIDLSNSDTATLPMPSFSFSGTGHDSLTLEQGAFSFGSAEFSSAEDLSVSLTSATVAFAGSPSFDNFSMDSASRAILLPSGSSRSVFSVNSISLGGGTLDLSNNDLVVYPTGAAQHAVLSAVQQSVATGYNKGAWNGSGIISSAANADTTQLSALGVMLNNYDGNTPIYTMIDGEFVGGNDVLVRYTNYGDANLDLKVDGSDYSRIDNGMNQHLTGWANGDFNYDGTLNGNDYTLIDNTYNTQSAHPQLIAVRGDSAGLAATPSNNVSIAGAILNVPGGTVLRGGFDAVSPANFVSLTADVNPDGTFSLAPATLAQVYGGVIANGMHTLHLRALSAGGTVLASADVAFNLQNTTTVVTAVTPAAGNVLSAPTTNIDLTLSGTIQAPPASVLSLAGHGAALATVSTPILLGNNVWDFPVQGLLTGPVTLSVNGMVDTQGNAVANFTSSFSVSLGPVTSYFTAQATSGIVFADVNLTPVAGTDGSQPRNYINFNAGHGEIDFAFVGAECDLYIQAFQADPITVTADGVTTTPAIAAGAYSWVPVDTGATDDGIAAHSISIKTLPLCGWALGADASHSIRAASAYDIPSIKYAPKFGPGFSLGGNPAFVQIAAGYNVGFQSDGAYGAYNNTYADAAVTFVATTSSIELYTYPGEGTLNLEVDGVNTAQVVLTSGGWTILSSSLDGTKPHTYRITQVQGVSGVNYNPQMTIFCNLMFPGGNYSATAMPVPLRVVCVGDSITLGEQGYNSTLWSYPNDLQELSSNIETTNMGFAGADGTGGNGIGISDADTIANFTIKPDIIVVEFGSNDMADGISLSTFTSDYESMLSIMLSSGLASSSGHIIALGLIPKVPYTQQTSDSYSTAISNAVAAVGSSRVSYARTYSWLSEPSDYQPDGVHPNLTGWDRMAVDVQSLIAGL